MEGTEVALGECQFKLQLSDGPPFETQYASIMLHIRSRSAGVTKYGFLGCSFRDMGWFLRGSKELSDDEWLHLVVHLTSRRAISNA